MYFILVPRLLFAIALVTIASLKSQEYKSLTQGNFIPANTNTLTDLVWLNRLYTFTVDKLLENSSNVTSTTTATPNTTTTTVTTSVTTYLANLANYLTTQGVYNASGVSIIYPLGAATTNLTPTGINTFEITHSPIGPVTYIINQNQKFYAKFDYTNQKITIAVLSPTALASYTAIKNTAVRTITGVWDLALVANALTHLGKAMAIFPLLLTGMQFYLEMMRIFNSTSSTSLPVNAPSLGTNISIAHYKGEVATYNGAQRYLTITHASQQIQMAIDFTGSSGADGLRFAAPSLMIGTYSGS